MDGAAPVDTKPLAIDVFSDVVCPWCWIGKRKLEEAIRQHRGEPFDLRWRAFQLDPTIPPEGFDRKEYHEKKFGGPDKTGEIYERISAAGKDVGIEFAFDRIRRSPNTLDAHRLLLWAYTAGVQWQVKEDLMRRYFVEGDDLGQRDVLIEVARGNGMDADLVARLLAEDADADVVADEAARARSAGISGVPFFVFDGKFAVPGAQSPDVLSKAIDKARDDASVAAA